VIPLREEILGLIGFFEGNLPFMYLGVPITVNRLSKMKCRLLFKKVTSKISIWTTRSISYIGRVALLDSALFDIYKF